MRVQVDRQKCVGHTMCNMNAPEIYKLDEDGYAFVDDADIPGPLQDKARKGARACPELAIMITEEK